MDKQELRNAMSEIEDDARHLRNMARSRKGHVDHDDAMDLISRLTKIIREEIVK